MIETITIKPIQSKADYQAALQRIDEIIDAKKGSIEYEESDVLSYLIEQYEAENVTIPDADPIMILEVMMEERGLIQQDLATLIGSKGIASELMNRKRKLSLNHIRKINKAWKIPVEVLVSEY